MEAVLSIKHLTKDLGGRRVLDNVTFDVFAGEVFGFLGPNGAGKTTTIKILTGLLKENSGEISVCGKKLSSNFEDVMSNIGAIVENPEMYKHLTGMDNLKQFARMRGISDKRRITEVVELVGLSNRINDRVKKYSLGMKQRLGVAQALLHKPRLLVLDEPTNGLDPAGIKHLRDILKELAHKEQAAVLVSSHLMSEMELMCDRVGIIVNGRVTSVKPIDEMLSTVGGGKITYRFKVKDTSNIGPTLEGNHLLPPDGVRIIDGNFFEMSLPSENTDEILERLVSVLFRLGTVVLQSMPIGNRSLEDVFITLTSASGQTEQIA